MATKADQIRTQVVSLLEMHGDLSSRTLVGADPYLRRHHTPSSLSAFLKRQDYVDSYVRQGVLMWTLSAGGLGIFVEDPPLAH